MHITSADVSDRSHDSFAVLIVYFFDIPNRIKSGGSPVSRRNAKDAF